MSLFDSAITAAASVFLKDNINLQDKMAGLIKEFFDEVGGLTGLVKRFQSHGLTDMVSSWINNTDRQEISTEQLHQVVGSDLLESLAKKAELDSSLFDTLLAKGLPKLISNISTQHLTQDEINNISLDKAKSLVEQMFS